MIRSHDSSPPPPVPRKFEVRVGHHVVRVDGRDSDDAVEKARAQLCHELPRMWDVIHALEATRFEVTELN